MDVELQSEGGSWSFGSMVDMPDHRLRGDHYMGIGAKIPAGVNFLHGAT